MITLWSQKKFENKLTILKEACKNKNLNDYRDTIFDSTDQWETIDVFEKNDSKMYFLLIFKI